MNFNEINLANHSNTEKFEEEIDESTNDEQHFYLLVFLIYEKLKGEKSFWHPYFEICDDNIKLPYQWTDDELMLLEDDLLILEIHTMRDDIEEEWDLCKQIGKEFPDEFPGEGVTNENLTWATNLLFTRAFGIGCPFTMVVPFAD